MKLRPQAPKHQGTGVHREVAAATTFERIRPHLRTVGVTRVADITGLDRVGIPVYNAVVPRSHDRLSVYNGKGATREDARASAVMEAVERFCAWQPRSAAAIASYADLAASGRGVMDPASHNLTLHPLYRPDRPISWVEGLDLVNDEPVLLPQSLVGYHHRFHEPPAYQITTGTGLASGNTLEEAVCHALAEVIERDDFTMAEVVGNRLKQVVQQKLGGNLPAGATSWLEDRSPTIDLATLPPSAHRHIERFQAAGIRLVLRDCTSATGITTVVAASAEEVSETFSSGHAGYGSHPDAEVAVLRALTEVAQSRAVDIQGMREDLSLPGAKIESWDQHVARGKTTDPNGWPFGESGTPAKFGDLPSTPSDDVMVDLRLMVDRLAARGLPRVIAVDLTAPGLPVSVARVIVPGAEAWSLDQSKLGPRAAATWDSSLKALIRQRDAPAQPGPQANVQRQEA